MAGGKDTEDAKIAAELTAELERLGGCGPFGALGVSADATEAEIRGAFLALTKVYHPNRFARRPLEVIRLANEVYLRIKSAYGQLSDPATRPRQPSIPTPAAAGGGDPPCAVTPAEGTPAVADLGTDLRARQRAARQRAVRRRAERGRTEDVPVLPRAITEGEQLAARREEEVASAQDALARGEFTTARREFHRLAIADPQRKELRVYLHFAWGREHEASGDADSAAAEYNRALKLAPDFEEARMAVESLRKKTKARGLLSKLFGK